ncbi:hypothetical protein NPIL_161531 [Nephila pilipes]|uniref:Uncharacterized protein n=1 Tax=Nephila pilipes TaxID=299642 RepID=A0A8X6PA22_NEPPI|nr:hypothetical protein NPIL_161531 [Nephila pilipes]
MKNLKTPKNTQQSSHNLQKTEKNSTERRRRGGSKAEEDGRERNGDSTRRDTLRERGFRTVVESRMRFSGELLRERERRCSETGPGRPSTAVRHEGSQGT